MRQLLLYHGTHLAHGCPAAITLPAPALPTCFLPCRIPKQPGVMGRTHHNLAEVVLRQPLTHQLVRLAGQGRRRSRNEAWHVGEAPQQHGSLNVV